MKKFTKLIFFGCSFTYGQDSGIKEGCKKHQFSPIGYPDGKLSSDFTDPHYTYPTLIGKRLDIEIENLAYMGNSNEAMMHQLYDYITYHRDLSETLAVINITGPSRFPTTQFSKYDPAKDVQLEINPPIHNLHLSADKSDDYIRRRGKFSNVPQQIVDDVITTKNVLSSEDIGFQFVRNISFILAMKQIADLTGLSICILDMMSGREISRSASWYNPIIDTLFENEIGLISMVDEYARKKVGYGNYYRSPQSGHFNQTGYGVLADMALPYILGCINKH